MQQNQSYPGAPEPHSVETSHFGLYFLHLSLFWSPSCPSVPKNMWISPWIGKFVFSDAPSPTPHTNFTHIERKIREKNNQPSKQQQQNLLVPQEFLFPTQVNATLMSEWTTITFTPIKCMPQSHEPATCESHFEFIFQHDFAFLLPWIVGRKVIILFQSSFLSFLVAGRKWTVYSHL